jgi:hypothetical protein
MYMDFTKAAVVVFDSHLHDISTPGSHYTIVVPGAANEQVVDLLNTGGVSVWNDYYITKAVRILSEAGYQPIVVDGIINISPHDEGVIVSVESHYPHDPSDAKGMGVEVEEDEDE